MSDDGDIRDRVEQLRQQVELLGHMLGETLPGSTGLVPTTQRGVQAGHEVRRIVMDDFRSDRVLGAVEQEVIIDPQTREHIVQTTLHYAMSLDGRVIRDQASVYRCGICREGPLVEPKFCHRCNIPLCSYHTETTYRGGNVSCQHHR